MTGKKQSNGFSLAYLPLPPPVSSSRNLQNDAARICDMQVKPVWPDQFDSEYTPQSRGVHRRFRTSSEAGQTGRHRFCELFNGLLIARVSMSH